MNDVFWSFDFSAPRIVIAVLLVLVSGAISLAQYRCAGKRPLEGVSEIIRLVALILVAFTILRPELVRVHRLQELPQLSVLLDRTGSMQTRDVYDEDEVDLISRDEWVEPLSETNAWQELKARYRVSITEFGSLDEEGTQVGTDLHAALDDISASPSGIRASVLVSDGDWTVGDSPIGAAAQLRSLGIPVFTMTVGSERYLPDIELVSVKSPVHVQVDEQVHISFVLKSRMERDFDIPIVLTESGSEVARSSINLPAMGQVSSSITFTPSRVGDFEYALEALPLPEEVNHDNNRQEFDISVRRQAIRVLIVDMEPRWEYRYLRNAAIRDPGVRVDTLLMHPHLPPGAGANHIDEFPQSREELSKYDVVFLGDIGMDEAGISEEQARWLRDLVHDQASGLVFMPGPDGRWISLLDGPLQSLVPVDIDLGNPKGHGAAYAGKMALTMRGTDHRLTRLAPTLETNQELWSNLPGFNWYAAALRPRPGAEVLVVHAQARGEDGRIPLIVATEHGAGKVLYMGHDSAWRWRRGYEDLYHYRFWNQVFRWMSYQRYMAADEGLRFFYTPENPVPGDRLWVQATPLDSSGFPLEGATIEAQLSTPSGSVGVFSLSEREGQWGVYHGSVLIGEGGEHDILIRCIENDAQVQVPVHVSSPDLEPIGRPARPDVMREIASVSGGTSYRAADGLEALIKALIDLPEQPPRESRFRLWSHHLWLLLMTAFLVLYWCLRKFLGRI